MREGKAMEQDRMFKLALASLLVATGRNNNLDRVVVVTMPFRLA